MIPASKKILKNYFIGLLWLFGLLWPLLGIHADGTLSFGTAFTVWFYIFLVTVVVVIGTVLHKQGLLTWISKPAGSLKSNLASLSSGIPQWVWLVVVAALAMIFPLVTGRYEQDVAINVLVYVCLGLGLNIVVGLAGMLDLGYIAFYGVGAYTYALLSVHYQLVCWLSLPVAAIAAMTAGCIIGFPTLRMRGDYLAIVTLGFGEIVRIILNNWMELTNGPNGILGIKAPGIFIFSWAEGFSIEHLYLKKLHYLYYVILLLSIFTIIAVRRLNLSRIGRSWEAIREDETAAELMGVNTYKLKLLAYAMGALFAGLAGAFFAARMRFVSPESFTFLESATVLAMVVLGGMASIPGVILGALALIVLPELFREFELYRMLCLGGAMVLIMVFKPGGFIPAKRVGRRSEEREG
ncbi:MAG: high-affinity branched-chain amino acid ABC transporter permease LivM [Desulfosarcina sp.]|nr:high-affinity branched-chain amino acid ABC transporter permease LivM [Desulfobacterales bacterium]